MKKNKVKAAVIVLSGALTAMHLYNRFISKAATSNHRLTDAKGQYFNWTHGKIYYTKRGTGEPILLVHDTDPTGSGAEWSKIATTLAKDHTVYTIDLLGCGRSDKPGLEYNNYLYAQLITAFVKEVIGERTDVIASNLSSSFVISAQALEEFLFDHIICINPTPIEQLEMIPDTRSKLRKGLLDLPIIGTFLYNILSSPLHLDAIFKEFYFAKAQHITAEIKDTYYEAAHLKNSRGKYLLSSIFGNYMNVNLKVSLQKINKPICIIGSRELERNTEYLHEYEIINRHVDVTMLSGAKNYPQLEIPEKTLKVIIDFLNEEFYS